MNFWASPCALLLVCWDIFLLRAFYLMNSRGGTPWRPSLFDNKHTHTKNPTKNSKCQTQLHPGYLFHCFFHCNFSPLYPLTLVLLLQLLFILFVVCIFWTLWVVLVHLPPPAPSVLAASHLILCILISLISIRHCSRESGKRTESLKYYSIYIFLSYQSRYIYFFFTYWKCLAQEMKLTFGSKLKSSRLNKSSLLLLCGQILLTRSSVSELLSCL